MAPKGRIKILIHFITEGKIVFFAGGYLLLQVKLTIVAPGEKNSYKGIEELFKTSMAHKSF